MAGSCLGRRGRRVGIDLEMTVCWPQPRWGWVCFSSQTQGCSNPGLEDKTPLGSKARMLVYQP